MEKHERIVRDLNEEFKKVDKTYITNEMRIFGRNTGRIFKELDVIRRKQIELASEHVSLEAIQDMPTAHQLSKSAVSKSAQSIQELFSSKNFIKKETMLKNMMEKLDELTQAMDTFNKIRELNYDALSDDEEEDEDDEDDEEYSDNITNLKQVAPSNHKNDSQFLTVPIINNN